MARTVRASLRRFASEALVDFSAAPPGLRECVRVIPEFVTRDEERALAAELDPIFARQRYRRDHWDGVITGYKETERHAWAREENAAVVERAAGRGAREHAAAAFTEWASGPGVGRLRR